MYYIINFITFSMANVSFDNLKDAEFYWTSIDVNRNEWTIVKCIPTNSIEN